MSVPDGVCGYTYAPDSTPSGQNCCLRSALEGRNRCLWHTKKVGKRLQGFEQIGERIDGAYLRDAKIRNVTLKGSSLSGSELSGAVVENCNFSNANFKKTDIKGARVLDCQLSNTNLKAAVLDEAEFLRTELSGSDLTSVTGERVSFRDSDLSSTYIRDCTFESGQFIDTRLDNSTVEYSNLTGSVFVGCIANSARIFSLNATEAQLSQCDFQNSEIEESTFVDCEINDVKFDRVELVNSKFTESILRASKLREIIADSVTFHGVNLERTRFADATFYSCDFTDTYLYQADFSGVSLDEETEFGYGVPYELHSDYEKAVSVYRQLSDLMSRNGLDIRARRYRIQQKQAERRQAFLERRYAKYVSYTVFEYLTLYGESASRVIGAGIGTILYFAFTYPFFGIYIGPRLVTYPSSPEMVVDVFVTSLLLSISAFVSSSVIDVYPATTTGRFLAGIEGLLGIFFVVLLSFILARKSFQ